MLLIIIGCSYFC
ncbi:sporulation protein YjcZ [Bacillus thuringiensis]|nr:sporulation protein YjcZ [Bacillus cereus]PEW82202.1 sporulation protein YjcZ [Bacillus thuringiensis]PFB51007.1 sporulation protein YjcZ [Bacillus thuringiensis]PFE93505.1 sporulation protein YjcZ [Bacillus thuringiensis]PGP49158.1 sporulation protein YjcZ [Bacillus thuringiensis]